MWSLCPKISSSGDGNTVRLLVGKEYVVGRKDCPVLIRDDPSISRRHGSLTVTHDVCDLNDPNKIPQVVLSDTSKYGISVNNVKVIQSIKLKSGDEILFGIHSSIYRLNYKPLVVVTSCLENSKKKNLKKQIYALGGHILNEWKSGSVTHLVMDGLLFTVKVIHGLAECCPIVTPDLFDELIKAVETNISFPNPNKFLPPLKEETIKSDGQLFLPDNSRKTLFVGKTFIFLSKKQYKRTYEAIEMCGGETIVNDTADASQDYQVFVKDGNCVMMVDQKERDSLPLDTKQCISQIMDFLKSNKKRPIPESELGLAILQMALANYCNPDIDAVPALTQNIVCQSLNVGLEDMSQIFLPQHKEPAIETKFKKPSVLRKDEEDKKLEIASTGTRKPLRSTSTTTVTEAPHPSRQNETTKIKDEFDSRTVSETQDQTLKSQKTKDYSKICNVPESLNQSGPDITVLAAETPVKPPVPSLFASHNVIPDSMAMNASRATPLVSESPCKPPVPSLFVSHDTKHNIIPDSMAMNASRATPLVSESPCKPPVPALFVSHDTKHNIIPDSMAMNATRASLLVSETAFKCSDKSVYAESPKKEHVEVPDSIGFNVFSTIPLHSEPLHTENRIRQDAIPDSMDINTPSERHTSSSSPEHETSGCRLAKRTRTSSRAGEIDVEIKPKRIKTELNSEEHNQIPEQCLTSLDSGWNREATLTRKREEPSKEVDTSSTNKKQKFDDEIEQNQDMEKKCDIAGSSVSGRGNTVPDGFLRARMPREQIQQGNEEKDDEDGLPRNLVVLDVVSLVVRRPNKQISTSVSKTGKNFKKFKKQWYAGCDRRFPMIIGGSDLVVHQTSSGADQQDWFIEARQTNKEQEKRDRMEDALFMSDAGLPQRRKGRRP